MNAFRLTTQRKAHFVLPLLSCVWVCPVSHVMKWWRGALFSHSNFRYFVRTFVRSFVRSLTSSSHCCGFCDVNIYEPMLFREESSYNCCEAKYIKETGFHRLITHTASVASNACMMALSGFSCCTNMSLFTHNQLSMSRYVFRLYKNYNFLTRKKVLLHFPHERRWSSILSYGT